MKKILIVYLSLLFSVAVCAQTATNAILFKISGNGLKSPSYILGSFHIMRGETVSGIPNFEKIYKAIPQVCFETDMNQSPSSTVMGEEVQPPQAKPMYKLTPQEILLPADSTYDKIIGVEKAAEVDTVMKTVFPMYVSNMRPTYAAIILQMMYSMIRGRRPSCFANLSQSSQASLKLLSFLLSDEYTPEIVLITAL